MYLKRNGKNIQHSIKNNKAIKKICGFLFNWEHVPLFFLLLIIFLFFYDTLNAFFVEDDFWYLKATQHFSLSDSLKGVLLEDTFNKTSTYYTYYFRPLSTYWFPLLNHIIWGTNSFGFHLSELLVFLLTIFLLYKVIYAMVDSSIASLLGTAVYGLSKLHLMTLGWLSGSIDLLAVLFSVLTIKLLQLHQQHKVPVWTIAITLAAGLLSKEIVVILPLAWTCYLFSLFKNGKLKIKRSDINALFTLWITNAAYIILWLILVGNTSTHGTISAFNVNRFIYILQGSFIVAMPLNHTDFLSYLLFLFFPILGFFLFAVRKARIFQYYIFSIALWLLPALFFAFLIRPTDLYLYYANFSLLGLSFLLAIFFKSLIDFLESKYYKIHHIRITSIVCLMIVVFLSARVVNIGIKNKASPSLYEAQYSESAYEQLAPLLNEKKYKKIILLNLSDYMWASMGYGDMFSALFPNVHVVRYRYKNLYCQAVMRTTQNILVIQQTGDTQLSVVR